MKTTNQEATMTQDQKICAARRELSHRCDGPVTRFVLIHRAMVLAQSGVDAEVVANALYDELEEGLVDADDFIERDQYGS